MHQKGLCKEQLECTSVVGQAVPRMPPTSCCTKEERGQRLALQWARKLKGRQASPDSCRQLC